MSRGGAYFFALGNSVIDILPLPHHLQLKRDKKTLQTLLERYEWAFKRVHGRGVNCRADIVPVEAEYVRYRKIKQKLNRKSR